VSAAAVETRATRNRQKDKKKNWAQKKNETHEKSGRSVIRLEGQSSQVGLTSRFCGAIALEVT